MKRKAFRRAQRVKKHKGTEVQDFSHTIVPLGYKPIIDVNLYRKLTGNTALNDQQVVQRLWCMERLCRGVIIDELNNYE